MSVILLTNDDGIDATGIKILEKSLADLGELWVIAPTVERSACSRAVTLNRPLRVHQRSPKHLAVDGTPADCVLLAFRSLLPEPPVVVISGINRGVNLGEDLDYSGTVAAAAEGALQGAKLSVAFSTYSKADISIVKSTATFAQKIVKKLIKDPLPDRSYLNVNYPMEQTNKFRFTKQAGPLERGKVVVADDPRGQKYYWIAERPEEQNPPPDTDRGALKDNCISISLLTLDRSWPGSFSPKSFDLDSYQEG